MSGDTPSQDQRKRTTAANVGGAHAAIRLGSPGLSVVRRRAPTTFAMSMLGFIGKSSGFSTNLHGDVVKVPTASAPSTRGCAFRNRVRPCALHRGRARA